MKEINVTIGQWYAAEGAAGDTITNPSTGRAIATVEDGKQSFFYATSAVVVASSDSVQVHRANFKSAPAKLMALGLFGGGSTIVELPKLAFVGLRSQLTTDYVIGEANVPQNVQLGFRMESRIAGKWLNVIGWYLDEDWLKRVSLTGSDYGGDDDQFEAGWRCGAANNGGRPVYAELGTYYNVNWVGESFYVNGQHYYALKFGNANKVVNTKITVSSPNCQISYYFARWTYNGETALDLEPRLTAQGFPCLFDKVAGKEYTKADMVAGFTLEEARKLGKLPATGGTLTISLPSNWQEDEGVLKARAEAEAKGWQITVQTYEAEAGAVSTFALRRSAMRRIWVRKTPNEYGSYVAADGSRWSVDWCVEIWGADPQELGYELFLSVDAAVAYWELQPWVDPEEEAMYSREKELLTTSTTNEHE